MLKKQMFKEASKTRKICAGILLAVLVPVIVVGICLYRSMYQNQEKSQKLPRQREYQTKFYQMTYDSQLCHPTYKNGENCEFNSGEVWQFEGFDNDVIYVDGVDKPYVQKGVPVLIVIDDLWHTYQWGEHLEDLNKEECLLESVKYFSKMIEADGNTVVKETRQDDQVLLDMEDGNRAAVKVLASTTDLRYYYESIFCQYDYDNTKLNDAIQRMYDSFTVRGAENAVFKQEEKGMLEGVDINVYASWEGEKLYSLHVEKRDEKLEEDVRHVPANEATQEDVEKIIYYEYVQEEDGKLEAALCSMALNEVTKEEFKRNLEEKQSQKLDMGKTEYVFKFKEQENKQIVIYRIKDEDSYLETNGQFYLITDMPFTLDMLEETCRLLVPEEQ